MSKLLNKFLLFCLLALGLAACDESVLGRVSYEEALATYEGGGDYPNYKCAIELVADKGSAEAGYLVVALEDKAYLRFKGEPLLTLFLSGATDEYFEYEGSGVKLRTFVLSRSGVSEYEESADQEMRLDFSGALGSFSVVGFAAGCGI